MFGKEIQPRTNCQAESDRQEHSKQNGIVVTVIIADPIGKEKGKETVAIGWNAAQEG